MRLFYDSYTTRTRAELTLVAADMLAMVAVALYLAPALLGDARALDKALLVVWAATPRALARILAALDQPSGFMKVLAAATAAVVLIAALLGAGWDLIHSVSPPGYAPTPLGLGMLLCAWGAGFLVCQPGAYRLFDFFLGGAILAGLKDGAPQPYIWIPVFLLAICLSAAVRHLLHDVFEGRRNPPINLQNARVVALLGAGAATVAFLAICLILGGGRFPVPAPRDDGPGDRFTPWRFSFWRDGSGVRGRESVPWHGGAPGGAGAGSLSGSSGGGPHGTGGAGGTEEEPGRRISFTQHVRLDDLSRPEMESAVVLRVRARPDTPAGRQWRPPESVLWKGITLATYDATTESWKEPVLTEEADWPMRLPREIPADLESRSEVTLLHTVVNPVFENFITPYFTSEISTEDGTTRVLTYSRSLPGDDIFPWPALEPYSMYAVRVVMADANHVPDVRPGAHTTVDPRYHEIPAAGDLGVDIRAVAGAIFEGESGARSRLESLRRFFEDSFEYSVEEDWTGGDAPIREFLLRRRRGDCAYFATAAALLLRAADLPTRFVAGFSGGEWEPTTSEVLVRNGRAHGWIEVHIQGAGWYPVDATLWVAPPSGAVVAVRDLSLEAPTDPASGDGEGTDEAGTDPEELVDGTAPPGEEEPTEPHAPATADGAAGNEARGVSPLRPPGEDGGIARPGVVEGLRSFVRVEPAGAADSAGAHGSLTSEARALRGDGVLGDGPREPGATPPRRPLLSGNVRVILRAMFLLLSIIVLGMLIYVYVRPPRKKDGDIGEEEDEEENFHLPADATTELSPILDRTDPRDRVVAAYHQLQVSLRATRSHRRPHQTPLEHAWSLREKPAGTEESFRRVHNVLYRVLYGGQEVGQEEARSVELDCQRIRRALG